MTVNLIITILAYAVSMGAVYGGIKAELRHLEKKVDVHNHLIERMYRVEARLDAVENQERINKK